MDLFANDLSIHRQFHDVPTFRTAIAGLMEMRNVARRFGRDVYCNSGLLNSQPIPDLPMRQAVQQLLANERRALLGWLTRGGPFWDELRQHGFDDWLECRGELVTDSAVGEAAYRTLHGVHCGLASVTPSEWDYSPVEVRWCRDDEGFADKSATLMNWRDAAALEERLQDAAPPIRSWVDLQSVSAMRFRSLTFAGNCFDPLAGVPFTKSAADRILVLLEILDRSARAFDADGNRTPEGNQLYQDHFTGDRALFSDSSDPEKRDFRNELTFPHPASPGNSLFCTWHGKERRLTLRLHFSWPIRSGEPVYVVYAGPKLTKR